MLLEAEAPVVNRQHMSFTLDDGIAHRAAIGLDLVRKTIQIGARGLPRFRDGESDRRRRGLLPANRFFAWRHARIITSIRPRIAGSASMVAAGLLMNLMMTLARW